MRARLFGWFRRERGFTDWQFGGVPSTCGELLSDGGSFKHCTKYKAFGIVGPSASCRQSYNIQRAEVKKCNKECGHWRHTALFVQYFWSLMFFCGSPIPVNSAVDPSLIPAHLSSNQQSADAYVIRFQRRAAGIFGGGWEALSVQKEMCAQTNTFVKL